MGGVQSGTHNLGEALWVQERQRQRCQHRESNRSEGQTGQSSHDRRKLLKRTRSLAVISEDESRQEREARHFRIGEPATLDHPKRYQLIPRAKLIDRNSLKDRLSKSQQHLSDSYERFNDTRICHSRSACGLYSIPSGLTSLPDHLSCPSRDRTNPDRLNILDWPEPPRRYRSVQALDTVSGLVDIVEDNWPVEGNRSVDCIYTQVKRKRKEHRSLDSILFEDDSELEYFDVLNLLPLSNVRLEFDEEDARNSRNFSARRREKDGVRRALENRERSTEEVSSTRSNVTDEEKCRSHSSKDDSASLKSQTEGEERISDGSCSPLEFRDVHRERERRRFPEEKSPRRGDLDEEQERSLSIETDKYRADVAVVTPCDEPQELLLKIEELEVQEARVEGKGQADRKIADKGPSKYHTDKKDQVDYKLGAKGHSIRKVEEAEDYKSIWISDCEDHEDMSRRPQVLKVVDSDVTKRKPRRSSLEKDVSSNDVPRIEGQDPKDMDDRLGNVQIKLKDHFKEHTRQSQDNELETDKDPATVENARSFFERKNSEKEAIRNQQNEGRFERIVKETSNILGKACNAVRGTLGFEARSESSDLGLGSESGSDSRRRSVDDGIEDDRSPVAIEKRSKNDEIVDTKSHSNLTRSKSCVDSIECQDNGPEFDHVRYKVVKSNVFSKNLFTNGKKDVTYEGLMQYLREYSFQELLLDNNVVIIEPVRAETVERKSSAANGKGRAGSTCKVAGAIQKKSDAERNDKNEEGSSTTKSPKQSSIRKHFFYHPIRVNRELIDEELPDPDTVRNVRRMFEDTLKKKSNTKQDTSGDCKNRKSVSMKDLSRIDDGQFDEDKLQEAPRSRCSSRAKDLTRLFESMDKSAPSTVSVVGGKEDPESPRSESKTRILAQSFEARSGHTSPSDSNSSKNKNNRYHHHHHHHHNWDAGSVSSGVSSDYPETDPGSGVQCTSSEDDEEVDCQDDDIMDERGPGHYVSQDVLKKIRECGTSVTYYGGKVVNTYNGPLISPLIGNRLKRTDRTKDYVKFKLVKSNSCDSRLELTGRLVEGRTTKHGNADKGTDLRQCTIDETPSIEVTAFDTESGQEVDEVVDQREAKREPPVVIGLEPKRDENREPRGFKADFRLGNLDESRSTYAGRFTASALNRWQINESNWKSGGEFGKMEFEEFEVLEDSLNGTEYQNQRDGSS